MRESWRRISDTPPIYGFAVAFAVMVACVLPAVFIMSFGDIDAERVSISTISCVLDKDCVQKDLVAQVRTARAAELGADIALWSLALSCVGFATVAATLVANVRSTQAAVSSVEHAERTSKQQLRAYVSVTRERIGTMVDPEVAIPFRVICKNAGQTPALRVTFLPTAEIFPIEEEGSPCPLSLNDVDRAELVLFPGQERTFQLDDTERSIALTPSEWQYWHDNKLAIAVKGYVVYDDVFGNTHWTQFAHIYPAANQDGYYAKKGNTAV